MLIKIDGNPLGLMPFLMKKFLVYLILCFSLSCTLAVNAKNNSPVFCTNKQVLGNIEKVTLLNHHLTLDAKVDTGAEMSSLSALNMQIYKDHHKLFVTFLVVSPNNSKMVRFIQPVVSFTHIRKRKDETINTQKLSSRPVIKLPIAIGQKKIIILVNLIDRSEFKYPFLLGSDVLKKINVLVDVNQQYLAS